MSGTKETASKVSGFDVTKLEVAGQYVGGMSAMGQAQSPRTGQRMLAAIINTDSGPYYFKFVGPDATVKENGSAFEGLLASMVAAP